MRSLSSFPIALALLATAVGCGSDPLPDDAVSVTESPIFNGASAVAADAIGVVRVSFNGSFICSAVVYNQNWIVTAAHCIPVSDLNRDGVIDAAEGAGRFTVGPLLNGSGTTYTATVSVIRRHPFGIFNDYSGTDLAMLWTSSTISMAKYDPRFYANGKLNIHTGTKASLLNMILAAWGYGPTNGAGANLGTRNTGTKQVTGTSPNRYYASTVANGTVDWGTSCDGDSGGPDYLADGSGYVLAGVHSTSDNGLCNGARDQNVPAEAFRDWVMSTGMRCESATRSGPCAF